MPVVIIPLNPAAAVLFNAGGEEHGGDLRERGEVIITEPFDRFNKVFRKGGVIEKAEDRLGREINGFDGLMDDAGDGLAAEGDADDGADFELFGDGWVVWGGIGENAAILAEKFAGDDLVVHRTIIACCNFDLRERRRGSIIEED